METPLLQTKLAPPLAQECVVPRPHLLRRLDHEFTHPQGFSRKLTLFSAPAGYGKSTLAINWLRNSRLPFIWLSLDESDNDPARLLTYLLAALQQFDKQIGSRALAMLAAPGTPSYEAPLTTLINDIQEHNTPVILVLDDYHAIHNPAIHKLLSFLLEHQPDCLHQVILTREEPPLPLHRLRARRQMTEIRQGDLRFSPSETDGFLRLVMGIQIELPDVEALTRRTEGWVAGLQLAALSLRSSPDSHAFVQSFTGSNRYVLDYLFEEVFQHQPPDVQSFLLTTSILERLTAPLCNALSGRDDSQEQLEALEKANLFIVPMDHARRWYRYHRLFADLLRHQLHKTGQPSERKLHQQASRWYWENNFPAEAVDHALRAEDWELAANLVQASSDGLLKRGEAATVVNWCTRLPGESLVSHPVLYLNYAWALMLTSQFDAARRILMQVEKDAKGERIITGEVAAARAYLAQSMGEIQHMVELSHQALALLPPENLASRGLVALNLGIAYWHIGRLAEAQQALDEALPAFQQTGNTYGAGMASLFLARTLAVQGQLHQAEEICVDLAQEGMPANPLVYLDLGSLHYEWNNLERADEYLQQALETSRMNGNLEFEVGAQMLLARLRLGQGDPAGAGLALEQARQLEQSSPIPLRTHNRRLDMQTFIALWKGDLDEAGNLVASLVPNTDAHPFYRFLSLTPARFALGRGDHTSATRLLEAAIQKAHRSGWTYGLIAALALQAAASTNSEEALEYLGEALDLAHPQGYIRTFVEAGPQLEPLLQEAARRGLWPEYAGQILAAFPAKAAPREKMIVSGNFILEALSERELEVLRLMAAGLSNREIARQLVLSLGTVKTHLHNIYGKLEARNRAQAVDRARELQLL
ncbi:MAG TPA: LuxR C-terminal-related transcriptional regulator [Anaerolineales bacterium]|nr:LuxR C-terminal-related transcriptional regulator [Anaerolineales bacterium]